MSAKIALVTGANQGIGYYIARNLVKNGNYRVVMACRSQERAQEAVAKISEEIAVSSGQRLKANCRPPNATLPETVDLDLSSSDSVDRAIATWRDMFPKEKIDVVVNNAGMMHRPATPNDTSEDLTVDVNFTNTVKFTEKVLPLMGPDSRVVMVSSRLGALTRFPGEDLRKKIATTATIEELYALAEEFKQKAKKQEAEAGGWPAIGDQPHYTVSKALLNVYVRSQADRFLTKHSCLLNACCPGWCSTRLTQNKGTFTAEEGAATPTWLATHNDIVEKKYHGYFFAANHRLRYSDGKELTKETINMESLIPQDMGGPLIEQKPPATDDLNPTTDR